MHCVFGRHAQMHARTQANKATNKQHPTRTVTHMPQVHMRMSRHNIALKLCSNVRCHCAPIARIRKSS